jgi:anti-sigma B factor antagonist
MDLTLITRRATDRIIIIEASGRLVAGDEATQLRDLVKRLTSEGERFFVLNVAGISYMDSSGLGLLLSIYATIRGQGGDVKLVNVGDRVKDLLKMTKLSEVFQIFESENRALAASGTAQ